MPSAELPFGGIKDSGDAYLGARSVAVMNV